MNNKIVHAVMAFVLFAIPVVQATHAGFLQITIGGLLNAAYLWASQIVNPTAPING